MWQLFKVIFPLHVPSSNVARTGCSTCLPTLGMLVVLDEGWGYVGYNSTKKGTEYKWRVNQEEKLDLGMLFASCLHWLSALWPWASTWTWLCFHCLTWKTRTSQLPMLRLNEVMDVNVFSQYLASGFLLVYRGLCMNWIKLSPFQVDTVQGHDTEAVLVYCYSLDKKP